MRRGVLLDLDGVLMRFRPTVWPELLEWLRPCTQRELAVSEMLRLIQPVWEEHYLHIVRMQVTRENEAAFWHSLASAVLEALKSDCSAGKMVSDWPYFRFLEPMPGVRVLLEWLKIRGFTVAVYGNTVPSIRENLDYHGLGQFVDHAIASANIGYVKPDGRGYCLVAEQMDLAPNRITYFDADEYNVRYARKVGYRAYLVHLGEPGPEVIHDLGMIYEVLD